MDALQKNASVIHSAKNAMKNVSAKVVIIPKVMIVMIL